MKNSIDKQYLSLQFRDKLYRKNGTEFQSFFEDIMQKVFPDTFKKIAPYGNSGDGGNDGYIPTDGTYYQVYAPKKPSDKDATAAKKFVSDFNTLKSKWSEISKIKTYNFVFNDKLSGSSIKLEKVRAELERDNPSISFNIFCSLNLEEAFEKLNNDQLVSLGFDVDSRNALKNAKEYLQKLEVELDRGNANFVLKTLETIRDVIVKQGDEGLVLDFEIIESRTLQKLEKIDEAKKQYENIYIRYPQDVRAPLYLAEIYLNEENFLENERLLNEVKIIDSTHWLYLLETLIRDYRLGKQIDISTIDEDSFPSDPKIKSDYYRLYSLFLERSGDTRRAEAFIERAIKLNPEKFNNYEVKFSFIGRKLDYIKDNKVEQEKIIQQLLSEMEDIRNRFIAIGNRSQVYLNIKKANTLFLQENYTDFGKIAKETFELSLVCYFDSAIDDVLSNLLKFIELPKEDFDRLLAYLGASKKQISDDLAKTIFLQFLRKNAISIDGRGFFTEVGKENIIEFINNIEGEDYEKLRPILEKDIPFAVNVCVSATTIPELRKKIIEMLPNDGSVQKEKLLLLLEYEEGNIDDAFEILRSLDLSKVSFAECRPALAVAQKKKAWDFVVILLNKLLQYEKEPKIILQIKLELFTANLNLERFPDVISMGEDILNNPNDVSMLDEDNLEIVTCQIAQSWARRSKYLEAMKFIEEHKNYIKKFEGKLLEASIYVKNNKPEYAINAIVSAFRSLRRPSSEDYGNLFLVFTEIGNQMDFSLIPMEKVKIGSFVKFKGEDSWFFIGDDEELDAIKITKARQKEFLGKKVGEKIVSKSEYRSDAIEREIENVLPIEKYILWQSVYNAQKLSLEGWDKMVTIEVPKMDEGIDPKYLIRMLENQQKRGQKFFEMYCEENIPLALLVVNEGGLPNAIGKITNEQKGFIKASNGTLQELLSQKKIAEKIIDGQEFYIDGTSALMLSETGLLKKIQNELPNIKIPQSVISLLLKIKERFEYSPGQVGNMYYAQGRIGISNINQSQREIVEKNFSESIEMLESNPENIEVISSANKSEVFSEKKIPAGLCDACILSQRDGVPILTEDFLYLHMNELETKKTKPQYCSSMALIRVLYEKGKISFEKYLNFFSYLSLYRFRFLPISIEDLEKAVFGDNKIKVFEVENLRKFNFPLTLSEEYGVPFKNSAALILQFIIKLLVDDTVSVKFVDGIFAEIVRTFPTSQNRKALGRSFVLAAAQIIKRNGHLISGIMIQEKIDSLSKFIETYSADEVSL